jgi:hypothetical protein
VYNNRLREQVVRCSSKAAYKIIVSAHRMLATGQHDKELGEVYLDSLSKTRITKSLVQRLEGLGYDVSIKPKAVA